MTEVMTPLAHYYETVEGHFWFKNAYDTILASLPTDRPSSWVEVGVFQGQSIAYLGVEAINRGLPITIYAVDTFDGWEGTIGGMELANAFGRNVAPIRDVLGDRFVVHTAPSVGTAAIFANHSLDVVWVDADHRWSFVKADIEAWLPKLKPGGVIGGDDWELGGVRTAVSEAFGSRVTLVPGERLGASWPSWMVRV